LITENYTEPVGEDAGEDRELVMHDAVLLLST
jgi:hypothetical protein